MALQWSLQNCSGAGSWLELQFLRILADELQLESSDTDRSRACSAIWRLFCDLQTLAADPHPELAWWLNADIQQLDSELHQAIDLFIAEQHAGALQICEQTRPQVRELKTKSSELTKPHGFARQGVLGYARTYFVGTCTGIGLKKQFENGADPLSVGRKLSH